MPDGVVRLRRMCDKLCSTPVSRALEFVARIGENSYNVFAVIVFVVIIAASSRRREQRYSRKHAA